MTESETTVTTEVVDTVATDNEIDWDQPTIPKGEFDKRLAKHKSLYEGEINSWKGKYEELEVSLKTEKKEALKQVAVAKYGQDLVENEKVAEVMSKYDGMSYDDAIKLSGLEPKKFGGMPIARTPSDVMGDKSVRYREDLPLLTQAERTLLKEQNKKGEIRLERRGT